MKRISFEGKVLVRYRWFRVRCEALITSYGPLDALKSTSFTNNLRIGTSVQKCVSRHFITSAVSELVSVEI